jgi:hypothetical protein
MIERYFAKSKLSFMKFLSFAFSGLLALSILSSCSKTPQACITVSKSVYMVGESASLSSCSVDAERVLWNFGDGSAETEGNAVSHAFAQPGTYLIEMRALSKKDKKWDRSSVIITVNSAKSRYLTRIQLNSYNINNPSGTTWDIAPNQNPDLVIEYGLDSSATRYTTNPVINDVALNQLPVNWDFSASSAKPILSNSDWRIVLLDSDGTILAPAYETMAIFKLNPGTIQPTSPGKILLTNSNYQLELTFIEL